MKVNNPIIYLSEANSKVEKKGTAKIYPVGLNKTAIAEGILLGAAPPVALASPSVSSQKKMAGVSCGFGY